MLFEGQLRKISQVNIGRPVDQLESYTNAFSICLSQLSNFHPKKTRNDRTVEKQIRTGVTSTNNCFCQQLPDPVLEYELDL